MTAAYPDIVKFFKDSVNEEIQDFIIDSELVAYDKEKDQIRPFQVLTTRSKKNVTEKDMTIQVCIFAFDLLYLNGKSLLKDNFVDRRKLMHTTFTEIPHCIQFAKYKDAYSFEEIEGFLNDSIKDCCEGLMVKTLDVNATYEPSKRSFNWLKLKKDYLDTDIGDSLDLVVVGADFGTGKRTGFYGSFLLACYDEDTEKLQTVCKIGTGFTDEMLAKLYAQLEPTELKNAPASLRYKDKNIDVWLEPKHVWEIKAADLQISPVYCASIGSCDPEKGIALRFPRFIRERDDKGIEESTSSDQIKGFYQAQATVNIDFNEAADFDL